MWEKERISIFFIILIVVIGFWLWTSFREDQRWDGWVLPDSILHRGITTVPTITIPINAAKIYLEKIK